MYKKINFIFIFLITASYALSAHAVNFQSARTMSLAKGGRAGPLLSDTVTVNPSMLGFYPISAFSGTYFWKKPKSDLALFNVSAIDGANEYFGAGLSYTRDQRATFIHVSASKKLHPTVSIGAHGKRVTDRDKIIEYDGGASISFGLSKETVSVPFQLALTSDNLRNKAEKIAGPREVAIGGKANFNDLLLVYLDDAYRMYQNKDVKHLISVSAEVALAADFFIRGGKYFSDEGGLGLGVGWVGPKLDLNYGFQKEDFPKAETRHAITLDIYM